MTGNRPTVSHRHAAITYAVAALALNVPFVLGHPDWPAVDWPWVRSLMVGLVLFLVPGIPWLGVMIARGWLGRFGWLWAVMASPAAMLAAVVVVRLLGWPLRGGTVWNLVWAMTNVAVGVNVVLRGPPAWALDLRRRAAWFGLALFLAAHLLFSYGATRVVPPQEDQDFQILSCGYGFLTRFEPLQAIHLGTIHQFAHPPLIHWYTACSFLCFDRLEYLEFFDAASRRARDARLGIEFEWYDGPIGGLTKGTVEDHRVIGQEGRDYILAPPLNDGSRRLPVWQVENAVMVRYYERDPQKLAARTPNVFLAALTVALLGCWIGRLTGSQIPAVLIPLAYATSPEVFVRSSYGGYFAGSNFAALLVLIAVEQRPGGPSRRWWVSCFAAGLFLGLVNHKLILLPAAVVLWRLFRQGPRTIGRRLAGALLHPVVVGFAAATAMFWAWGLAVDPVEFWQNHLRTHYLDRLLHRNPYGFGGYPDVLGLWREFWQHSGYVLLPMGVITLVALALQKNTRPEVDRELQQNDDGTGFSPWLWLVWTLLTAVVFSAVDWRQTKHLGPLFLPLFVAPARWAAYGTLRLALMTVLLVGLVAWNLHTLYRLAADFAGFPITPAW